MPAWTPGLTAEDWWSLVFQDLDRGIVAEPYRRLLMSALERYGSNRTFRALADDYLTPTDTPEPAPDGSAAAPTCRVVVRASDEEEREAATAALRDLGLDPRVVWSTEHAMSFAVSSTDVARVRRAVSGTNLGWTVVAPGQPDYLLRELFVQGPDGSRFRLTDAPTAQTVGNVATEVVEQYRGSEQNPDATDTTVPTVVDLVLPDGQRRRLDIDDILYQAGIRDGDSLRVSVERRAGGWMFLCHSNDDKSAVRELHQRLLADGHQPWLDEVNLLPGQDWDYEIRKAIRASTIVLVCISAGSTTKRGYLQKEIRHALDIADEMPQGEVFLIPVRLEECDIPERLRRWQWVDLYRPGGYDRLLAALNHAL
jgi:hypothetical protein